MFASAALLLFARYQHYNADDFSEEPDFVTVLITILLFNSRLHHERRELKHIVKIFAYFANFPISQK